MTPDLSRARSVRAHEDILRATAELLVEGGLAAATTDAITARSGASKTTVYKHWPNRLAVAIDAFTEIMGTEVVSVDTGDTRRDFERHMRAVGRFYAQAHGRLYAELLAATVNDADGARRLREQFLDRRREVIVRMWRRGVDRGDIDPELDFQAVNDVVFGPIIFRLVSGHAPLDDDSVRALAQVVFDGALRSTSRESAASRDESAQE